MSGINATKNATFTWIQVIFCEHKGMTDLTQNKISNQKQLHEIDKKKIIKSRQQNLQMSTCFSAHFSSHSSSASQKNNKTHSFES